MEQPVAELEYVLKARISPKYATVLIHSYRKNWYHLYFYEHQVHNKYIGYLDLSQFIDFEPDYDRQELLKHGFPLDYCFVPSAPNSYNSFDSFLLACLDSVYVISFNCIHNRWQTLRKIEVVTGLDIRLQKSVKVNISPFTGNV
jgi:hypothetical protein